MSRKIIFRLKLALGDALGFTAGIRDFKLLFPEIDIDVDTNFREFFKNNPYITPLDKNDPEVEKYTISNSNVNNSNRTYNHYIFGFLFDMISQAGFHKPLPLSASDLTAAFSNGRVGDKDAQVGTYGSIREKFEKLGRTDCFRLKPDIHLTDEDKIKVLNGVEKYWVIAPGGKSDATTKIWDWREFQKVINYFKGKIKFVTIGVSSHILTKLDDVIDLTDKTPNPRDLIPIVYNAEGCVSGISFLMHCAAALDKPCVSIYGGRESVSYTHYNDHMILHTQSVLDCCDNGSGCWKSKVIKTNNTDRVCSYPVEVNGKIIPKCMTLITADDVIRGIEKYYSGNKLSYPETIEKPQINTNIDIPRSNSKTINILASIKGKGGGEQSAIEIGRVLENAGWQVNFVPIGSVHPNYEGKFKYQTEIYPNSPILFYGNDNVDWFCDNPQIYEKASDIIIGINFITGKLKNCRHLANDKRLKAILFQNNDALNMFKKQSIGFDNIPLDISVGAISLDKFIQIPVNERLDNDKLIIVKTGMPDWRKYVTTESEGKGEKKFIYQKYIFAEKDIVFYSRLIKDLGSKVEFRFMEAHSEVENYFKNNQQFKFYKFNQIPIDQFLRQGHIFLQRTSMLWDDSYPRSVAEAMASGLPVICEPRYGPRDRIIHGRTGLYFIDYDSCVLDIKLLLRKEGMRRDMGKECKTYARDNFDSRNWVKVINKYLNGGN